MHRSFLLLKSKSLGSAVFTDSPSTRVITMNGSNSLNVMCLPMVKALYGHYITRPHRNKEAVYVLKGGGTRSFCAGGDVLGLTDPKGDEFRREFFTTEYRLDSHIATMPNTQVALWQGFALGSGVGISLHGKYRVACENSHFAMPETQIGAIPDVASNWFFSRMRLKEVGAYLAITGLPLRGAELAHVGIATHFIAFERFPEVEKALMAVSSPKEVPGILNDFASKSLLPPCSTASLLPCLKNAFAVRENTTLEDIVKALEDDGSPFARSTLDRMRANSPTAMAMALESYKQHSYLESVTDAFRLDYTAIQRGAMSGDFAIGVKALLVDRSDNPQWKPFKMDEVDHAEVKSTFAPPLQNFI